MVAMVVIGFIMRKRAAPPQAALAGAGGFQYTASGSEQATPRTGSYDIGSPTSAAATSSTPRANIPADFDTAGFVRNAKIQFIRLQAANDAGNLDDIREFTTPEMFAEVKMSISERGSALQETDVVQIDADVIEVVEEDSRYVVSVRFSGLIREDKDGPAEQIDEIWHLVKPRDGKGGWLLAGIQQLQ
jgi:predicted lipid-binding transport protein (Tim44 family)